MPDTYEGHSKAELIVKEIELDYAKEQLKPLEQYKLSNGNLSKVILKVTSNAEVEFLRLWDEFIDFQRTQVEETKLVGNSPEIIYKYYAASKPEGLIIPPLNLNI